MTVIKFNPKICNICDRRLNAHTDFYAGHNQCKNCLKEKRRSYMREYMREYMKTYKRKEQKKYFEDYYIQNKKKMNKYSSEYKKNNPLKNNEYNARRRAKIRRVQVEKVDYKAIIKRDKMICYLCGKEITRSKLSFDHVTPISRGGKHNKSNIKCTHKRCNFKKHAKLLS